MHFASGFVIYIVVAVALPVLYLMQLIYTSNYELKIHWTQPEIDWTKARRALLSTAAAAGNTCNAWISAAGGFLDRVRGRISTAYPHGIRARMSGEIRVRFSALRTRISALAPTLGENALSSVRCARRRGRGSVPQGAANGRIQLKPTQERGLVPLTSGERSELTRGQYEDLAGVSRSQAAYDLAELVEAGILKRLGGGRATRYRLARETRPGQRHWTSDRIRAELEDFCAGRKAWPSAGAFKAAGRADLYVAASRYGGIGSWAAELGYARPGRAAQPAETSLRRKLAWAGAGALASAALAAAVAVAVVLSLPRESVRTVAQPRVSPPAVSDESARAAREGESSTQSPAPARVVKKTARPAHHRAAARVEPTQARPVLAPTAATLIVDRTYSPATASGGSSTRTASRSTAAPATSGGPAPLRAPLTASGPSPLKAP
jgi:hypothetical protein